MVKRNNKKKASQAYPPSRLLPQPPVRRSGPPPSWGVSKRIPLQMGDAAAKYAMALVYPFHKEAEGVRVPEPYAVATVTRKVHMPIVLTSSATGGLDFAVNPHLECSFVQTMGSMSNGTVRNTTNLPVGVSMRSAVTGVNIQSIFQSYRIVAIGVRLKTNVDFTKAGGRIYGALLPASAEAPSAFSVNTTVSQALQSFEIPNDGSNITTNIVALPRGFQFTVAELMSEGGAEVHFPICSASALDFLDGQSQDYEQHTVIAAGAGGSNTQNATGLGYYQTKGHSLFVLRGEGLSPSTDVLTAEVVYHVEGVPVVGVANLVESAPKVPPPAGPHEVHHAHRLASAAPVVRYVSHVLAAEVGAHARQWGRNQLKVGAANAAERILGVAVRSLPFA